MSKTEVSKTNYAIPGKSLNKKDFKKMIISAEEGKFYSVDDLSKKISEWKRNFKPVSLFPAVKPKSRSKKPSG